MKKKYKPVLRLNSRDIEVSVRFELEKWKGIDLKKLYETGLLLALEELNYPNNLYSTSVFACEISTIKELNSQFLHNNEPTNVLSWPQIIYERNFKNNFPNIPKEFFGHRKQIFLGDVAISYEYCKEESVKLGVHLFEHFNRMVTHSILHLLGFDHYDERDAKIMQDLEVILLSRVESYYQHEINLEANQGTG